MHADPALHKLPHREAVERFRLGMLDAVRSGGREVRALLEDRARSDQNVRRTYAGRYVLELLQNACDAHDRQVALHAEGRAPAPQPARAAIRLTDTHLLIANTGWPFTFEPLAADEPSGIESACRYGASSKTRQQYKGQFGIGLKSVDEVADEVFVASAGYRLRFCRERLRESLGDAAPTALPLFYAPEWFDDAQAPPCFLDLVSDYTTVMALRLRAGVEVRDVEERLDDVGPVEVLLLETLRDLRVEDRRTGLATTRRFVLEQVGEAPERWRVRSTIDEGDPDDSHFLVVRARIHEGVQEHRLAWMEDAAGQLAPLPAPKRVFYTFYPIARERSRAPFVVHSYFRLDPSRKSFAAEGADIEANRALVDGLVELLASAVPIVAARPRGHLPLHRLLWPEPEERELWEAEEGAAQQAASPGDRFVQRARARLWELGAIEGRDGGARPGAAYHWPVPGSGLDEALADVPAAPAPFPRDADAVRPRPASAPPLGADSVGRWLVDHPPALPQPGAFPKLVEALARLVPPEQRRLFRKDARRSRVIPVATDAGFKQEGLDERTQVFLPPLSTRPLEVPPALRGVLDVHLLHPDARGADRAAFDAAAQELLDLVPLRPEDLVERLARAVDAAPAVAPEVSASILGFVARLFRSDLTMLAEVPRRLLPWFSDELWADPGAPWRTRMRLASLPIPLVDGPPASAGTLVIEEMPGEFAALYPPSTSQRFLNRDTEHPAVRATLDGVLRELAPAAPADGWPFRYAVYAWLGAWPMPRLHAVYQETREMTAKRSPHPGVPDDRWKHYLAETGRTSLHGVSVHRSLAWPDLEEIVAHGRVAGTLDRLLEVVQRHAQVLLGRTEPVVRIGGSGQREYRETMVRWQLRTLPWLPVVAHGRNAEPARPDAAWWTSHRLDPSRLAGARWNHLPFLHLGACERGVAERLGLSIYEVAQSPGRDASVGRTAEALALLAERVGAGADDAGLRRLYRELTSRLAELRPTRDELARLRMIVTVSAGGALSVTPAREAVLDDLPLPLPFGRERLRLALFGPGCAELADRLGVRRLSQRAIRYQADDRDATAPEEPVLTAWLQELCPYAFALRAFGAMVPESQRIDVALPSTRDLVARFRLAVVEVVEAVELVIDGVVVERQSPDKPVLLAHGLDERGTLPVFMRRDFTARHEASRLLLFYALAGTAAHLAGDASLAHSLELLARESGPGDPARAERFLRERCGVSMSALRTVREVCGEAMRDEEAVRREATRARAREDWRARCAALCRPLLARLLTLDRPMHPGELRTRLDTFRDAGEGALAAARVWFALLGLREDDSVWAIESLADAEADLIAHPTLAEGLRSFLAEEDDAVARARAGDAALGKVRIVLIAWVRAQQPEARLDDLLALWDEAAEPVDRAAPDVEGRVARAFLGLAGVGAMEIDLASAPPDGRWGGKLHLAALGLDAEHMTEMAAEIQRYDELASDALAASERAYRAWVRQHGLHRVVERRELQPEVQPESRGRGAEPAGPVQRLSLDSRGGPARHGRQGRRNSVTGGLGELFVVLQEIETWRALAHEERVRLARRVAAEFGGDPAAAALVALVEEGPESGEAWDEALFRLLRIGDYVGARCDVLGLRRGTDGAFQMIYVEVKSTRLDRLDAFEVSEAEWEFLRKPTVRGASAIACVCRAARGATPVVEILADPARLVDEQRLTVHATSHRIDLRRGKGP